MITHFYQEGTHAFQNDPLVPTFRRRTTFSTTIDYMFLNPELLDFCTDHFVHFVNSDWTDHALLSAQLTFAHPDRAKGLWRANPQLASNKCFCQRLFLKLDEYHAQLATDTVRPSPQVI